MTIIYSIFAGVISGFLWGKAFEAETSTALLIGGIVGVVIGVAVTLFGKMAMAGGKVIQGEATFVNSSIITVLTVLGIASGIIAWIIRAIFF